MARRKKINFFIGKKSADSSFIKPPIHTNIIEIPAKKLSSYISSKVKLLKLEAEGAEPEILKGIGPELNKIEYISADLGPERGEQEKSTLVEVTNFLFQNNFSLVEISHKRIVALFRNNNY